MDTQTLPYAKEFEHFALTGLGVKKLRTQVLVPEPPGGISAA